jgi:parallel beta-helix repeat protein
MSGDYSRRRFDPAKHYAGVLMQQGRVQLDSDWNELAEIEDRRWRAAVVDTLGRTAVGRATPDAFLIDGTVATGLTIGTGRMFVDGLVAENFGARNGAGFDPILDDLRSAAPIPLLDQPYLSSREQPPATGPFALFLDVWQREVTAVEDPQLLETALGVDTTTRVQTVWQVKALTGLPAGTNCSTLATTPAWTGRTAPSGGRLTTRVNPAETPQDPCLPADPGGYRGLDNRLYRIEIHGPGGAGVATFKWARDNASVAMRVTGIAGTVVSIERPPRDAEIRVSADDWVELTDDVREWSGRPGVMCQVDQVRDTTGEIVLKAAPAEAIDVARNGRLRRWDHRGGAMIPVPAWGTAIELEKGVEVVFSAAPNTSGTMRTGDYWVFAARTADASVEALDAAPPRGIHHHYAPLAVVDAAGIPHDCRPQPEHAEGCCDQVVAPGDALQGAIDSLPVSGGCVCFTAGVYVLDEPLRVEKSNVILHAEAPGCVTLKANADAGIVVAMPGNTLSAKAWIEKVTLDGFRIELASPASGAMARSIVVEKAREVSITRCTLDVPSYDVGTAAGATIGIHVNGSERTEIEGCRLADFKTAVLGTSSKFVHVSGNRIEGPSRDCFGVRALRAGNGGSQPWSIVGNTVYLCTTGIYLDASTGNSVIAGNTVSRGPDVLIDGDHAYAIDVAGARSVVTGNEVNAALARHAGIRVAGPHSSVRANRFYAAASVDDAMDITNLSSFVAPIGIYAGPIGSWADRQRPADGSPIPTERDVAADDVTIADNTLFGRMLGISVLASVTTDRLHICGNRLTPHPQFGKDLFIGIVLVKCAQTSVEGNVIERARYGVLDFDGREGRIAGNVVDGGHAGLSLVGGRSQMVADNRVTGMKTWGIGGYFPADATLTGNRIARCGFEGISAGIGILGAAGTLTIDGCEVIATGISKDASIVFDQASCGIYVSGVERCVVRNTDVSSGEAASRLDSKLEHRALVIEPGADAVVDVTACRFEGIGLSGLVALGFHDPAKPGLFREALFTTNRCTHSAAGDSGATVRISASVILATGNRVSASRAALHSLSFPGSTSLAAVGNVSSSRSWDAVPSGAVPQPTSSNVFGIA